MGITGTAATKYSEKRGKHQKECLSLLNPLATRGITKLVIATLTYFNDLLSNLLLSFFYTLLVLRRLLFLRPYITYSVAHTIVTPNGPL